MSDKLDKEKLIIYGNGSGKLFIKPSELFALRHIQELIERVGKSNVRKIYMDNTSGQKPDFEKQAEVAFETFYRITSHIDQSSKEFYESGYFAGATTVYEAHVLPLQDNIKRLETQLDRFIEIIKNIDAETSKKFDIASNIDLTQALTDKDSHIQLLEDAIKSRNILQKEQSERIAELESQIKYLESREIH